MALKSSCQNAVAISCMLLADEENERIMSIIGCVLKKGLTFSIKHQEEHRSSDQCRQWLLDQARGGYFDHVKEIIGVMFDTSVLEQAGLTVQPVAVTSVLQRANEGEIQCEDDFASILGQLVFEFVAEREDRALWMLRGWP